MNTPRKINASTIPTSNACCCNSGGTLSLAMMTRNTNRLSIDSEYSVSQPPRNCAAYSGPLMTRIPAQNNRAAPMKNARSRVTSRIDGSCGRRPTTNTSTARNPTATTSVTIHTHGATCTCPPANLGRDDARCGSRRSHPPSVTGPPVLGRIPGPYNGYGRDDGDSVEFYGLLPSSSGESYPSGSERGRALACLAGSTATRQRLEPMAEGSTMQIWPGSAYPLGATYDGSGTNFALFSEVAERVELCLFDADGDEVRHDSPEMDGFVWHAFLPGVEPG